MNKPILILKIGTSSITNDQGSLDKPIIVDLVRQVANLNQNYRIIMVSSGAVGTGKSYISNFDHSLAKRKAAAAIGNPILINMYATFFDVYNIKIAQSLCERSHFANTKQFNQLQQTFEELWDNNVIPIANENDVVSNLELKFSDNDELATLLAIGFNAEKLLIVTAAEGVLNKEGQLVKEIKSIDQEVLSWADKKSSSLGLGGMVSKLNFSRLATKMGIHTTIFGFTQENSILKAVKELVGTQCLPQTASKEERSQWLSSGNLLIGKIKLSKNFSIDHIKQGIFSNQIDRVINDFEKGEVFELVNEADKTIAVAQTMISSKTLNKPKQHSILIAPKNQIILL